MNVRRAAYLLARILGDTHAIRTGRVGNRLKNRVVGRLAASLLRGLFK